MGRGIIGLQHLPKINITNAAGGSCSIKAYRTVLYKIQELQANKHQNDTLTSMVLEDHLPYSNSIWTVVLSGAVGATGTITTQVVEIGNTVTINGQVFTGSAADDFPNGEFLVTGTNVDDANRLREAIRLDTRPGNLTGLVTATVLSDVVTVTADATGTDHNQISLESNDAVRLLISGPFLTGGLDPTTYTTTFISEDYPVVDSINITGLTVKKELDIAYTGVTFPFTVRSLLSVIRWIEAYIEVRVSSALSDAPTNGTYSNGIFKGATPYETFLWPSVVKLNLVYTLTPGVDS